LTEYFIGPSKYFQPLTGKELKVIRLKIGFLHKKNCSMKRVLKLLENKGFI